LNVVAIELPIFNWVDLPTTEQEFEDYKGKYLEFIPKKVKRTINYQRKNIQSLGRIDFELN